MPLKKSSSNGTPVETSAASVETAALAAQALATSAAPKAAPKQSMPKSVKLDKESYWERKEERDIETGKRIRRSGVWQAALQSMAGLQFNQAGTLEGYLTLVDKLAEHGLAWVNKD